MTDNSWFTASKEGLRRLIEHLPKSMVLYELVQNCWDEDASVCQVTLTRIEGTPYVEVVCRDDNPEGFKDLTHAFTIWADSDKKKDPTKRGRWNEGEKKVLALCRRAEISSTKGTILFNEDGTRTTSRRKTEAGSVFTGELRMTREEVANAEEAFARLIPDGSCGTSLNGEEIEAPELVCEFETTLHTVIEDEEGNLRPTKRKTTVRVYEPREGDAPTIYEHGIPVVETGDRFHVNVLQKVPLNRDRDNVPPAFLRALRGAVLIHTVHLLNREDAAGKWVDDGAMDSAVGGDVLESMLDARHGKKRALYDGSDLEANKTLHGEDHEIIPRGSLAPELRKKILDTGAGKRAGDIRPTPQPYSDDPEAPPVETIPLDEWTREMKEVADIVRWMAAELDIHDDLLVRFVLPGARDWGAAFGTCGFDWNVSSLGWKWFDNWYEKPRQLINTIIHEFSHNEGAGHLDRKCHNNATWFGAGLVMLALFEGRRFPHFRRVREYLRQGSQAPTVSESVAPAE